MLERINGMLLFSPEVPPLWMAKSLREINVQFSNSGLSTMPLFFFCKIICFAFFPSCLELSITVLQLSLQFLVQPSFLTVYNSMGSKAFPCVQLCLQFNLLMFHMHMVLKEKKYNTVMSFGRKANGFCLKKGKREHRLKNKQDIL